MEEEEKAYLSGARTQELWDKSKATFGANISTEGATIILKNAAATPQILSQATMQNATQSSSGAFASTDKAKLDGIASGATKVVVDASLSDTGTNPVQGKAVKSAIDGKLAKDATAAAAAKMATARSIRLAGDVTGSASFDGTADAHINAAITELSDAEIAAICTLPSGGVEGVPESEPVGKWELFDPGVSPAAIFGGTWAKRSDTHLFMGCCVWRRVS